MCPAVPTTTCFITACPGETPLGSGTAHLAELLLVVFPEEDVPLLASLRNLTLLREDLGSHPVLDFLVPPHLRAKHLHDHQPDAVAVPQQRYPIVVLQGAHENMGEMGELFMA